MFGIGKTDKALLDKLAKLQVFNNSIALESSSESLEKNVALVYLLLTIENNIHFSS